MVFKKKGLISFQTVKEEIVNSITHGIGFLLSIAALVLLICFSVSRGTAWHVVSCSLYGSSLVILYLASTLYHAISHEGAKKVLRRLDHISIYFLIAGTFMPLTLVVLRGALGWTLFGIECGLCLIGTVFKAVFGPRFSVLSAVFYLLMGWIALIAIKPLLVALSIKGFLWIILGGVCYTLGILFFATDRKVSYFHAIWHLFVLGGSICHFFMVFLYVIPFS